MTASEALARIRSLAGANKIRVTGHARDRMGERAVRYADLRHALTNATKCVKGDEPGKWRVEGKDLDGDDVTLSSRSRATSSSSRCSERYSQ